MKCLFCEEKLVEGHVCKRLSKKKFLDLLADHPDKAVRYVADRQMEKVMNRLMRSVIKRRLGAKKDLRNG